jgi:hypothetical protein
MTRTPHDRASRSGMMKAAVYNLPCGYEIFEKKEEGCVCVIFAP